MGNRNLHLQVVGVEDVMLGSFAKPGARCPLNANCTGLLVPDYALVQINLVFKNHVNVPTRKRSLDGAGGHGYNKTPSTF